jgi:hypothetical protein
MDTGEKTVDGNHKLVNVETASHSQCHGVSIRPFGLAQKRPFVRTAQSLCVVDLGIQKVRTMGRFVTGFWRHFRPIGDAISCMRVRQKRYQTCDSIGFFETERDFALSPDSKKQMF